ncbi:MAG TPA: FlgD immunoglobulin-like domain containing protein [Bacteroidota bacterium]|nr:FlgD immunoglobulin-like domain containing protein [Bacteroidota bacterium]
MRYLLLLSIFALQASAQQRYLVTPKDEVIPLRRNQAAANVLKQRASLPSGSAAICGTRFTFGYPEDKFPANSNFGATHKDVLAEWLIMPTSGTLDTLFWEVLGSVGAQDSTILISVHQSRIGPNYGPGANGGNPFAAPCQMWGYYPDANELDGGITPYLDEATDTNWVSTFGSGAPVPTLPPTIGLAIWGGSKGFSTVEHSGMINYQDMAAFDTLKVNKGDLLWVSQRVNGPAGHTTDSRTEFAASGFRVTLDNENFPSRDWKFYMHDSGPSNCSGHNPTMISRGWVARGGFGDDSLDVGVFNWWYAMTVTSNTPPDVRMTSVQQSTFSSGPYTIEADIRDCDPSDPGNADVDHADLEYSVDNVAQPAISMLREGGTIWQAEIPAQNCGHQISYRVKAYDNKGETGTGVQVVFSVVCFGSPSFYPDTGAACTTENIAGSGTVIPNSSFFLPPTAPSDRLATDGGTAGPFYLGGNMTFFGGDFKYAWIGVNGGIALSKNATDTLDVNSNGDFTTAWSFPYGNVLRTGRDTSSTVMSHMPINFIAPAWNDMIVADTLGTQFGHIRHQAAPGGDTCLFVAEWDSVGKFLPTGSTGEQDESRFRCVLNRCDGTIEFQYDNVGYNGLDTTSLIGMQGQTNAEYIFMNLNGYPEKTRPRNNWCVRFYPGEAIVAIDSWNLVCACVEPYNNDYSKSSMFPTAIGPMFTYNGAYIAEDPLISCHGYWAKFSGAGQLVGARGRLPRCVTVEVQNSWNIVCGPGCPVATSMISVRGGIIASSYFGYGLSGYFVASTLTPGYAYWCKMVGGGSLEICCDNEAVPKLNPSTDLETLNKITIVDAAGRQQTLYLGESSTVREPLSFYELPPPPPGFDARYTSGRMVETYPAILDKGGVYEYPIVINEAAYPVTVRWNVVKPAGRSFVLGSADGKLGNTVMSGSGSVRLPDAAMKSIVVRLSDVQIPSKYTLSQNYPNPFNPTTHFDVSIPKTAYVTVAIYDVLGRQVKSLMSGQQSAGYYTMEWDGRDARGLSAPTGIYFIRMLSDEFNQTQKIMLMK